MGIEPTYPAWKAGVLPLNYTRVSLIIIFIIQLFVNNFLVFFIFLFFHYFFLLLYSNVILNKLSILIGVIKYEKYIRLLHFPPP